MGLDAPAWRRCLWAAAVCLLGLGQGAPIHAASVAPLTGCPDKSEDELHPAAGPELSPAALDLRFRYGTKKVKGEKVAQELGPLVRAALNDWAGFAEEHDFDVVVSDQAEHLVLGVARETVLRRAVEVMDQTHALLDPLLPPTGERKQRAVIAFLFDSQGFSSDGWPALLEALGEQGVLVPAAVSGLAEDPTGLLIRNRALFLQPTVDMAGDASNGDDEFRLDNEMAQQFTQCLTELRAGPLPPVLRWGLGYVAENALFDSVYTFNRAGFVASGDHFDWGQKARQVLEKHTGREALVFAQEFLADASAGRADRPQIIAWGCLEYLRRTDPARIESLLRELGRAHRVNDTLGISGQYRGSTGATRAALEAHLDGIDTKLLSRTLKDR